MQVITGKRVLIVVIAVFSLSLMMGCSGMEYAPQRGIAFYHGEMTGAERAIANAQKTGKDRECPAEFNEAKNLKDKAFEVYWSCRTKDAIAMAKEATQKANALCPARPRAEMKPEAKPVLIPEAKPVPIPQAKPVPIPQAKPVPIPQAKPVPIPEPKPVAKVVEKVILIEDVHFDLDKSTLTKEAQVILKRNIQVLKENPNVQIRIQGHTSAIATEEYNQALSERRAKSVEEFLVKEGGIDPDRLSEIGYGETRLEVPEPNPELDESAAAQTNRRVIFKIIVK